MVAEGFDPPALPVQLIQIRYQGHEIDDRLGRQPRHRGRADMVDAQKNRPKHPQPFSLDSRHPRQFRIVRSQNNRNRRFHEGTIVRTSEDNVTPRVTLPGLLLQDRASRTAPVRCKWGELRYAMSIMTEAEVIQMLGNYYQSLFPKVCGNCICGSTIGLSSSDMPVAQMHLLLGWIQTETRRNGRDQKQILDRIRDEVRKQVLVEPIG